MDIVSGRQDSVFLQHAYERLKPVWVREEMPARLRRTFGPLKLRSGTQEMVSSMIGNPLPLRHTTVNLARLHAVMVSQHFIQQVTCARCPA